MFYLYIKVLNSSFKKNIKTSNWSQIHLHVLIKINIFFKNYMIQPLFIYVSEIYFLSLLTGKDIRTHSGYFDNLNSSDKIHIFIFRLGGGKSHYCSNIRTCKTLDNLLYRYSIFCYWHRHEGNPRTLWNNVYKCYMNSCLSGVTYYI